MSVRSKCYAIPRAVSSDDPRYIQTCLSFATHSLTHLPHAVVQREKIRYNVDEAQVRFIASATNHLLASRSTSLWFNHELSKLLDFFFSFMNQHPSENPLQLLFAVDAQNLYTLQTSYLSSLLIAQTRRSYYTYLWTTSFQTRYAYHMSFSHGLTRCSSTT